MILSTLSLMLIVAKVAFAEEDSPSDSPSQLKESLAVLPEVTGKWTGTWGPFDPVKGTALEREKCKQLDCTVVFNADQGTWKATFEGECGRPYKYVIQMDGRQAEQVVLFKGTVDLGLNDGGVYDWVGRATGQEFAGFYTSAHYIGVFRLVKQTTPTSPQQ